MLEIIEDTLKDSIRLLPFLFIAYLLMEYLEHKTSKKSKEIVKKSGKVGPLVGGALGAFPQCGFSVMASNLYAARIITVGTLVAIMLATSDEMLPLLLSEGTDIGIVMKMLAIKVIIGIIAGFTIDYILRNRTVKKEQEIMHEMCEHDRCNCEEGIFLSSIKHTLSIFLFILLFTFVLNTIIYYIGEDTLANLFSKNIVLGPVVASIIGLIPNCAASVVITELYISSTITLGATIAGLLSSSGLALLILFKNNKNLKENIYILLTLLGIGIFSGIIIDLIGITL